MATTQTHQIRVPGTTAADLFRWHARPGAVQRLTPAALGRVVSGPDGGLRVGARTRLLVGPNPLGAIGVAAGVPWTAVHTEVRRPDPTGSGGESGAAPYGFVDEQESGPFRAWRHQHTFDDVDGGATIRDEVTWALPPGIGMVGRGPVRTQVERMFGYRSRQVRADLDLHRRTADGGPRTVAISGASGLVGRQLAALLGGGGHRVLRLVRRPAHQPDEISWDPDRDELDRDGLRDVDVVVHLAGAPIGRRFSASTKEGVLTSRTRSTALLARSLAAIAGDGRDRALVCASAMGWYGDGSGHPADTVLTEDLPAADTFLAQVCRAWEAAADPAREAGIRTVHVRTGIVQSAAGGQLALQLPVFQVGLGGPLGDGRAWMSWISLDDLLELYTLAALTPDLSGPVNAAAPHPVRAEEYAAVLAGVLGRPHAIAVPPIGPRLLLGDEGARELALASLRLSSDRAQTWGQRFRHPTLAEALRHELCR